MNETRKKSVNCTLEGSGCCYSLFKTDVKRYIFYNSWVHNIVNIQPYVRRTANSADITFHTTLPHTKLVFIISLMFICSGVVSGIVTYRKTAAITKILWCLTSASLCRAAKILLVWFLKQIVLNNFTQSIISLNKLTEIVIIENTVVQKKKKLSNMVCG